MSDTGCVCVQPGYCERHKCRKGRGAFRQCRTNPKAFAMWEEGKGLEQKTEASHHRVKRHHIGAKRVLAGDALAKALEAVGVTKERVSAWIGKSCGCCERQKKLNQLDLWVRRSIGLITQEEYDVARAELESLIVAK